MMHFVRTFSIMRAYGVRLIAIKEVRSYGKIVYIVSIFENGWYEDAYSSSYPPVSTPSHKLQKLSKKSGISQSFGTINFVFFTKWQSKKGGHGPMQPLSINTLLPAILRNPYYCKAS